MKSIEVIADLTPDPRNANKGTERGLRVLDDSLRQYGAGRSILADKHGVVIAGNKTLERAAELGLPVRTVQTDGRELVVVQRTDLDLATDKTAKELALADNRSSEVGLAWDAGVLIEMHADPLVDLTKFWSDEELAGIIGDTGASGGDASPQMTGMTYCVVIECASEEEQAAMLERFGKEGLTCRGLIS